MNYVKNFRWFAIAALALVIAGVVAWFAFGGFNLGVDFKGGTVMTIDMGKEFNTADVERVLDTAKYDYSPVQASVLSGQHVATIRVTQNLSPEQTNASVVVPLGATYPGVKAISTDAINGILPSEFQLKALIAVVIVCVLMLIYVTIRFEFRMGAVTLLSLLLSLLLMASVVLMTKMTVNLAAVVTLLCAMCFTTINAIAVFDRVRENRKIHVGKKTTREIVNLSIKATMCRTIVTAASIVIVVMALFFLGGAAMREFLLPILAGLFAGLFTGIYLSAPLWCIWTESVEKRTPKAKR